jgi:hypothetical protein
MPPTIHLLSPHFERSLDGRMMGKRSGIHKKGRSGRGEEWMKEKPLGEPWLLKSI